MVISRVEGGPPATRAQTAAAPGNVLRTAGHLAADHGPFGLVLAGGLFDYLEERFGRALIGTTLSRPGGTFHFPPTSRPTSAPPGTVAGLDITADATGLTLFATVRRADEPG
jgi:hypothetical protein